VYLPSFGEWGFNMVNHSGKKLTVSRKPDKLRYYDFDLKSLTYFPKDMRSKELLINRINNQNLVTVFNQEWSSY
jgi:predicted membrane-bound spermidine synthase